MKRIAALVCAVLAMAGGAAAQTQITTGVIQGTVARPARAPSCRASTSRSRNVDTNFARNARRPERDGRFVFLQLPPGRYTVDVHASRASRTLVQEDVALTVGQTRHAEPDHEGVGRDGDGHRHRHAHRRHVAHRGQQHAERDHDRHHARSSGRKFEDLLTLTPGRQRRAGAGRRRDHLRRPARRLQQHQPRRRRLQQRLLRRADGRPARRHRHHARRGEGVPGRRRAAPTPSSGAPPAASSTSSRSPAPTSCTAASSTSSGSRR